MKIALFGGSFNPIHLGHIKLADAVKNQFNIDNIILMPAGVSPHKDNSNFVSSQHRYNMCKLAVRGKSKIEVSDLEIKKQGRSYSYLTLNSLKEIYPNDDIYMIVGGDMYLTLQDWKEPQQIFSLASLIAVPRNDMDYEILLNHSKYLEKFNAKSYIMKDTVMDISSTQIRDKIQNNEDVSDFLDEKVLKYINKYHLYGM